MWSKTFFILPVLLFVGLALLAQPTLVVFPTSVSAYSNEFETEANFWVHNLGNQSLPVHWERTIITLQPDSLNQCLTAVGDPNLHYAPHVSHSGSPFVVLPGDSALMEVYLFDTSPGLSGCCAIIQMRVFDATDSTNMDEVLVLLNDCTSGAGVVNPEKAKIYPNPATDEFYLENTRGYSVAELYDAAGMRLRQWNLAEGAVLALNGLAAGRYMVVLRTPQNVIGAASWLSIAPR